ncbi:MAG: hypothetical protein F6K40_08245 [Okeania sp. SIO3I5]|uniref:hypothetical protein n=1 Tax=Okeania sp. SIO3I5 TaxID=2607805 RepID=UPI0013BABF4F|nr:hypothetical protein [Okeania sp. SIO3I5]NEQ36272.1 hypothetical protein [Okeania sp. SIO3I5]
MAGLVAPEAVVKFGDVEISEFTGAGRVDADVRAASPEGAKVLLRTGDDRQ